MLHENDNFLSFNIAILYDIENLIGGYSHPEMLAELSLHEIFDEIMTKATGGIGLQRAYANWSDPRLNILRGDIVELGIEPIQMFGFGRGPQKNASDIHLAIDAIDIAWTRESVDTFVIVSGDGGFSILAKQLHEYGKKVIGCAYPKTTNKVFKAVCDEFIWLNDPLHKEKPVSDFEMQLFNNPIVKAYSKKHKPVSKASRDEIFTEAKSIVNWLSEYEGTRHLLRNIGLNISVLSQLLDYRLNELNYYQVGFTRFTDFIRHITLDTACKLVLKPPSEYRLVLKQVNLKEYEELSYITEPGNIHSIDNYRELLSKTTPMFLQFNKEKLFTIAQYIQKNKIHFRGILFGDIIDALSDAIDFTQADIKATVLTLISAKCFIGGQKFKKLSEQKLSYQCESAEQALEKVRGGMREKIEDLVEEKYNPKLLDKLLD